MILSVGACRLYREPTCICNVCGLRREGDYSRSGECLRERGEDAEVGMKRDLLDSANPERAKPVLVLQATEGPLDSGTSDVKLAPSLRLARDKRMKAVGLLSLIHI